MNHVMLMSTLPSKYIFCKLLAASFRGYYMFFPPKVWSSTLRQVRHVSLRIRGLAMRWYATQVALQAIRSASRCSPQLGKCWQGGVYYLWPLFKRNEGGATPHTSAQNPGFHPSLPVITLWGSVSQDFHTSGREGGLGRGGKKTNPHKVWLEDFGED